MHFVKVSVVKDVKHGGGQVSYTRVVTFETFTFESVCTHEVLSHVELENKTEALHRDTLLCSTDGSKWDEWSTVEKASASYLTDLEFWLGCF